LKLAEFIKFNKETFNWEYECLKKKFYNNIAGCEFDIGPDQATDLYTDLNGDGYFKEEDEIWKSIEFVRNELKKFASEIFSKLFKE
jgi:hypothetical protein